MPELSTNTLAPFIWSTGGQKLIESDWDKLRFVVVRNRKSGHDGSYSASRGDFRKKAGWTKICIYREYMFALHWMLYSGCISPEFKYLCGTEIGSAIFEYIEQWRIHHALNLRLNILLPKFLAGFCFWPLWKLPGRCPFLRFKLSHLSIWPFSSHLNALFSCSNWASYFIAHANLSNELSITSFCTSGTLRDSGSIRSVTRGELTFIFFRPISPLVSVTKICPFMFFPSMVVTHMLASKIKKVGLFFMETYFLYVFLTQCERWSFLVPEKIRIIHHLLYMVLSYFPIFY